MSQKLKERFYTSDEFEKLPEFNERYELLDGRLVEKPMPTFDHSDISFLILNAYIKFDPDQKLGLMRAEISTRIREGYTPAPDLAFWKKGREPKRGQNTATSRPDLAIEIQSPGQGIKMLGKKAEEYIKAGVSLVWIIQPSKKIVAVFRPGQDIPEIIQPNGELDGEEVIPGFKLLVEALFESD